MTGEAYLQSAALAERMGPFDGYADNREPMLGVIRMHQRAVDELDPRYVPLDLLERRARGVGRGARARRRARLPQLAGDRDRADRHDRLHDGLRHHRRRARHRAGQVQEAGRRRDAEDRQQHRAARAHAARLQPKRGPGDRRVHRRARDHRGRAGLKDEHLPVFDCAFKPRTGRASIHYHGHLDDGRGAAVHLRRDLQDHQHAGTRPRRKRSWRPTSLAWKAGPEGGRDLPRRLQAHAAAHTRRKCRGGPSRGRRDAPIRRAGVCRTTARAPSRTSSISPATRATSPSACTRTAARARSSSRWPSRARRSRA